MGWLKMRAPVTDLPIEFETVTIAMGAVTILDRVTMRLNVGSPTVIVGPNGSGKTTLLRAAMGLVRPTLGQITWGGRENFPSRCAIVFQRPTMLRRSAAANVQYWLRSANSSSREKSSGVRRLLELVGLGGLQDRPARRLSGGEQQRLALARALARDPAVLFLDEPTASLDPAGAKAIEELIAAISRQGIKVIMTTHDIGEARRLAEDVIMLHQGRVAEAAAASSFFNAPRTVEARKFIAGELVL